MKILFCSDGKPQAEKAVEFGALIAAACQAEATVFGIAENSDHEEPLLDGLRRGQEILKAHHVQSELITKSGRPVQEIIRRCEEEKYDLVVVGAERKPELGPVWMSTRAYRIIESVKPPVLVVIGSPSSLRRILICTSGGHPALGAVDFAGKIAAELDAVVDLFHVLLEPPAMYVDLIRREEDVQRILASASRLGRNLRRQQEHLDQLNVLGKVLVRHGMVVPELLKLVQEGQYDLVVAGSTPVREMLRKYMMGDVTREIVERARLPVLVMRTGPTLSGLRLGNLLHGLFKGKASE